ncbi:MAG TPA: alcohol dehydrogenase [Pirellulales bacterium]|jgi:D-arabinose 1-dehydrogenase-like Zn-dependent alcohol dehydrogenase|nr:alcohol dehydrogenase [Pirellulales bacterium]
MATMRVVQISRAGGPLELVERPIPSPASESVRIKVAACGICHSDSLVKEGAMPGIQYPRIPGHEVVGVIDAVGPNVTTWQPGDRVGVGWHGGYCGRCEPCRRGDFFACVTNRVTGLTHDGGYAEYMLAHTSALARWPEALAPTAAGPLVCAGVTTFNALKHSGARAGETVAVLGLGGLGHLGVQFAAKMGFRTIAIARGGNKAAFAKQLGAHHYIDSQSQEVAQELLKLGGAKVIVATVTNAAAMTATLGGLAIHGKLMILGAPSEAIQVSALGLLTGCRSVMGWYSGVSIDSQDTLDFSAMTGVAPLTESYPLERAAEAYERMMSGQARFRVVLTMGS